MLGFRCLMFQLTVGGGLTSHISHAFLILHSFTYTITDGCSTFLPDFQIWTWLEQRKAWWRLSKGLSCKWTSVCVCNRAFSFWLKMFQCEAKSVLLTVKTTFNWVSGNKKKKTLPQISCFDFSTRRPGYNSAVRTQSEVFYVVENKYSKKKFSK